MSKKIKLTEEQIVAIEKYLREDGNTIRGAAREVLGKESRESTIRHYIRKEVIDLQEEDSDTKGGVKHLPRVLLFDIQMNRKSIRFF